MLVKDVHVVNGFVSMTIMDKHEIKYTALFKKNGEIDRYMGKVKVESFKPALEDFFAEEFFRFCSRYAKEQEDIYEELN